MAPSVVTPVTVLTGFFGSGKTTLLKRVVADPRYADIAMLTGSWDELPAAGCLCCRVTGDLVRTLRELHVQRMEGTVPNFPRVVIETTGLADPAPLLATLVQLPLIAARYSLAGVVTAVDAEHGAATLDAHDEAVKQVAMADRIVLTGCDRAAPAAIEALAGRLAALNPGAAVLHSSNADIDPALLLETGLYRGQGQAMDARGWLNAGAYRPMGAAPPRPGAEITSFCWSTAEPRAWDDVESSLERLLALRGDRILRLKGLVNVVGEPGPRAVHAVQHTLYPSARLPAWPDADRSTRLTFIGRGLEPAEIAAILESFPHPARVQR